MNNKNVDKNSKSTYIFTRETMGMTLLLFSAIVFVMLVAEGAPFSGIGKAICTFMFGTFGYGSFLIIALTAYLGEWLVFEKKLKVNVKPALAVCLTAFFLFFLFHAATTSDYSLDGGYGDYIFDCYKNASGGYAGYTFGGVVSALIVYPVAKFTTFTGAYVIFSLLTLAGGYLIYTVLRRAKKRNFVEESVPDAVETEKEPNNEVVAATRDVPTFAATEVQPEMQPAPAEPERRTEEDDNPYSKKNLGRKILFQKGEFDAESYKRNMIFNENSIFNKQINENYDYLSNFSSGKKKEALAPQSYSESYQEKVLAEPAVSSHTNYVYGEKPVEQLDGLERVTGETYSVQQPESGMLKTDKVENEYSQSAAHNTSGSDKTEVTEIKEQPTEGRSFGLRLNDRVQPRTEQREPLGSFSNNQAGQMEHRIEREGEKSDRGSSEMFKLFGPSSLQRGEIRVEPDASRLNADRNERSNANLFDDDDSEELDTFGREARSADNDGDFTDNYSAGRYGNSGGGLLRVRPFKGTDEDSEQDDFHLSTPPQSAETSVQPARAQSVVQNTEQVSRQEDKSKQEEQPKQEEKPKHVWKKYIRPGLELLDDYPEHANVNTGEIEDNKRAIIETLGRFKIACEVSNVTIGPAITRYDVIIEDKTKIKQSLNYKESIAMALMKKNVNTYLNYSKGALSIEVPNREITKVGLKSMLSSSKFINCKPDSITFALGKNLEGEAVCPDITKMPHLLVAGTTGSGKSICLSSLLVSLLYKYGPEELRFILVDPKQVEFISFDRIPHLMINEIIYDIDKAVKALNWAIKEMERRYTLFKEMTEKGLATKNLEEYNRHLPEGEEKLPKIVIILDEFGDLMTQAKKDIEGRIIKLGQKSRASGIHLVLATQRPSVDCITGLIKSNLPTRIGFKVNSFDDSRTIFDIGGAEKLLGKGDLYLRTADNPELARIQGCFIDTHEVQRVTDFVKLHNETYFDQSVSDFINTVEVEEASNSSDSDENASEGGDAKIDETYIKALYYCVTVKQASVSMIQRRFPVGYIKACKIIDWMDNMNYITPSEGSKPRKVLLTKEEFINIYGEMDD